MENYFIVRAACLTLLEMKVNMRKFIPISFNDQTLEFVFAHTQRFSEEYYSFVNGQYTSDGGLIYQHLEKDTSRY